MKEFETYEKYVDWRTPVDMLEPELDTNTNEYREASLRFTRVISLCLAYIESQSDHLVALYGACYALNLSHITSGRSMREMAKVLDVSTACLSHHAKQARLFMGLEPSMLQQPIERAQQSRSIREKEKK